MRPHNSNPHSLPAELAAVSLIDAKTAAATGSMSESWWFQKVADKEAPQPVVRAPRCTRWRASDVADFYRRFAEQGDTATADGPKAQATKASAAASAKRAARPAQNGA